MLTLLSPAKRLDFDTPPTTAAHSTPALLAESGKLIKTTRNLSQKKLRELMPEVPADEIPEGMKTAELGTVFRVGTFYNIVVALLQEKAG